MLRGPISTGVVLLRDVYRRGRAGQRGVRRPPRAGGQQEVELAHPGPAPRESLLAPRCVGGGGGGRRQRRRRARSREAPRPPRGGRGRRGGTPGEARFSQDEGRRQEAKDRLSKASALIAVLGSR